MKKSTNMMVTVISVMIGIKLSDKLGDGLYKIVRSKKQA